MASVSGHSDVLTTIRVGGQPALDHVVSLVYEELRRVAHRQLSPHRRPAEGTPTLTTSGLVNEVYLKLVDQTRATWNDHAHFLALAAVAMRNILIDRARARRAGKRGPTWCRVTLEENVIAVDEQAEVMLTLNEALRALEAVDARLARVVEYRFFGGLSEKEIAQALGVDTRTVQRDWKKARMLLRKALAEGT